MKALKFIVIIIVIIVIAGLGTTWHAGFFSEVKVVEKEVGPYNFVFVEHFGDYKLTPQLQDSIYQALLAEGIETTKAFGIYYDNPDSIEVSKLHSIVGCVLEDKDSAKIKDLTRMEFRIEPMGKTMSCVVEFPFNSQFSIFAGIAKAYPALEEYSKEKNYKETPYLEIYDTPNKKIYYIKEIKK